MSLFQNSTNSFGHAGINPGIHGPRPILKRSQTPYHPSAESKRRRTSPTGAFSRLSISPTSARSTETRLLNPLTSSSSVVPSSLISYKSNVESDNNKTIVESSNVNNMFQFGLHSNNQFPYIPPNQSSPMFTANEAKMKSTYSAYDIDSNRIFVESLSDGERSPTPSIQLEDDQSQEPNTLELSPTIAHQLSVHHQNQRNNSANILLNSFKFISDPNCQNDQQVVLYRKPIWPSLKQNDQPLDPKLHSSIDISEPQIVEIEDFDNDVTNNHPLNSKLDFSSINNHSSFNSIDSMELD